MPTEDKKFLMDLQGNLVLQLQEIKTDFLLLQKEFKSLQDNVQQTATDMAVMKSRVEIYRTMLAFSILLNVVSVLALVYLIASK